MTTVYLYDKVVNYSHEIPKQCLTTHLFITVSGEVIDLKNKQLIEYKDHLYETRFNTLGHHKQFNMQHHSFDGIQNWYNIQLGKNEWRTVAITKPNKFNGKYLINFDFTTGYNTGPSGNFAINNTPFTDTRPSDPLKPYGFKNQNTQHKKYYLGGMELLDGSWTTNYPVEGPLQLFTKLLNDGVAIIHFTQSSADTIAYGAGYCDYSCNTSDYNRQCSTHCWTLEDNSCTKFSSCNNVADVYWKVRGKIMSNDHKYFHTIIDILKYRPESVDLSGLKLDKGGVFGWSVGAQTVSRYMNEFKKHHWPTPLFGILGAGGSLHCYEGSAGTAWLDPSSHATPKEKNLGLCPYAPNIDHADYLYKKNKLHLEPFYDKRANHWQYHPPVFGFQSENDSFADRWAVKSYINTLQYQLKINDLSNTSAYKDSSYIMAPGTIHGMNTSDQMNGAYNFANKLYA